MNKNIKIMASFILFYPSLYSSQELYIPARSSAISSLEEGKQKFFKELYASELSYLRRYIIKNTFNDLLPDKDNLLKAVGIYTHYYKVLAESVYTQEHKEWSQEIQAFRVYLKDNVNINPVGAVASHKPDFIDKKERLALSFFQQFYQAKMCSDFKYIVKQISKGNRKYRMKSQELRSLQEECKNVILHSTIAARKEWVIKYTTFAQSLCDA